MAPKKKKKQDLKLVDFDISETVSGKSSKSKPEKEDKDAEMNGLEKLDVAPIIEEKIDKKKVKVKALFASERVLTENSNEARDLYLQGRYGVVLENGQVQLSLHEALYLMEKGKLEVFDPKKKEIGLPDFLKKVKKVEPNFWVRYAVFKDMRTRGYIIKTALKFGADFRVYDRGVKPGEDHARWVVYPVHEGSTLTWYEFAAKNRVAHSTKKRLMLAVVDDESDVTYWEVKWIRP